ncbi:MAG: hypothetical protein NUK65_11760 [Firmicutes bacterium]|nr:hypothetical protein [Bacillota bacterium]
MRLEGQTVTLARGDTAKALAQRTVYSARRVLPEFSDVTSTSAVSRCAYLLRSTFGEPSYVVHRPLDGPVEVWVVSLKNGNGVLSFELWQNCEMPRYYIFTDKPTPIVAKVLRRLRRYLNETRVFVIPKT